MLLHVRALLFYGIILTKYFLPTRNKAFFNWSIYFKGLVTDVTNRIYQRHFSHQESKRLLERKIHQIRQVTIRIKYSTTYKSRQRLIKNKLARTFLILMLWFAMVVLFLTCKLLLTGRVCPERECFSTISNSSRLGSHALAELQGVFARSRWHNGNLWLWLHSCSSPLILPPPKPLPLW